VNALHGVREKKLFRARKTEAGSAISKTWLGKNNRRVKEESLGDSQKQNLKEERKEKAKGYRLQ